MGQNSPQHVPFGLYAEQFSSSAFTAPRHENHHSWLYRLRPSAAHGPYAPYSGALQLRTAPLNDGHYSPNRLRWDALSPPDEPVDFVDGLISYCANGDPAQRIGCAVHLYAATASMTRRAFASADGEFLIVPQQGRLEIITEAGRFSLEPQQIALIPRGMKFRVDLVEAGPAFGYVCENYGAAFRLPELGPIGSNGLANARDFEAPVAAFEDDDQPYEILHKFQGKIWHLSQDHSPFDVVAWHGNSAPYRYDCRRFNTIGTVSFDHPDPSLFTVLTSPSALAGTANVDFVIFPPRWSVADDSFRPPWFHRNIMSEFMGLISGSYDAKSDGFVPGGASLHNSFCAHGPDHQAYCAAVDCDLVPQKIEGTLAFMFESHFPFKVSDVAMRSRHLQGDYDKAWNGFDKAKIPSAKGPIS